MPASAYVSLKSLAVVALLGGSLLFAVVSLDAPGWRRWTTSTRSSVESDDAGRAPAPLRVEAEDAQPLSTTEAEDSGPHDVGAEGVEGGPQLALALDDSEGDQVVEAVGDESQEESAAAPVFWGDTLDESERQAGADEVDDALSENTESADDEPSLLPQGDDAGEVESVDGDELSSDRFTALEHRLRELGATQYRLETWGAEGELYRFRCLMAISETERYNRFFEATDPDALTAFEKVLAEVERWRANQQARAR